MNDDPVLRNILAAFDHSRASSVRLADASGIPLERLERVLHGEAPLLVVDAARLAAALGMTAAALFALPAPIAVPMPERLAYSLPAFAEAVGLSVATIRQAIEHGELTARYPTAAGRKPIITREDGSSWLRGLRASS